MDGLLPSAHIRSPDKVAQCSTMGLPPHEGVGCLVMCAVITAQWFTRYRKPIPRKLLNTAP